MNIQELYHQSSKIIPDLDARVLIKDFLDIDDTVFYRDSDRELSTPQINQIKKLISRRAKGEPIAYIIGHKEFFGLDFYVNKNVLVPRPETEWLVERALEKLLVIGNQLSVLDMGTGSGNIIISIAKNFPDAHYFATDISADALKVAKKNAQYHGVKIKFIKSDLFNNIDSDIKFDLIIANLPYVPNNITIQQSNNSLLFEPSDAIFAKDNGTKIIKRFLLEAKDHLTADGMILIELDPRNALEIKSCAEKIFPNATLQLQKDLAGLNRYLKIYG